MHKFFIAVMATVGISLFGWDVAYGIRDWMNHNQELVHNITHAVTANEYDYPDAEEETAIGMPDICILEGGTDCDDLQPQTWEACYEDC